MPSRVSKVDRIWSRAFGSGRRALALLTALGPYFRFMGLGQTFDNRRLLGDTGLAPSSAAHVYLRQSMEHMATIDVFRGALDP